MSHVFNFLKSGFRNLHLLLAMPGTYQALSVGLLNKWVKNQLKLELLKKAWWSPESCQLLIPPTLLSSLVSSNLVFAFHVSFNQIWFKLTFTSVWAREYYTQLKSMISWVHAVPLGLGWVEASSVRGLRSSCLFSLDTDGWGCVFSAFNNYHRVHPLVFSSLKCTIFFSFSLAPFFHLRCPIYICWQFPVPTFMHPDSLLETLKIP